MTTLSLWVLMLATLSAANPVHSSQIRWMDCKKHLPSSLKPHKIDLDNLPRALHCGRITVPMNYGQPIGPSNNITLGLAMYRPRNPEGAIFFNPGGTDEATIFAWRTALNLTQAFAGLEDFDLMMMDTRGTWGSNALNVSLSTFEPLLGPYPNSESEFEDLRAASDRVVQSWSENSSPEGILQHLGTREFVQDYEQVRKALGYEKIHLLGDSYGSFRSVQYASTFPEHVDRIALDAVVPHGRSLFDQAQDQTKALNRVLLRADAYCQNDRSCPFKKQGKGSVVRAFHRVLEMAEKAPLRAPQCIGSPTCKNPVTSSRIRQAMQYFFLSKPDFPGIFQALRLALAGNASIFAQGAADPIPSVEFAWAMPISCSDYDLGENDFAAFQRSLNAGLAHGKSKIGRTQAWQIQLWCSAWPFKTPRPTSMTLPNVDMLMVTADFDGSAPTEWTRWVWSQNSRSTLVIRHGDDHVSFTHPHQPSTHLTKEYLRTGKLPTPRDEERLTVYAPGMKLQPIKNPYDVPTGPIAGDSNHS